jgi:ankyrin repeat protein
MGALSENQDERKVELDNLLNSAMKRGRYEMVPLLLENGASLDSKIASIKKEEGTFKFNVNRDGKRRPGSTLLHMAALADDVEMIEFLLKKSPRLLNEPDDDLVTPVMSTVRFDSYEAFTSLMAHGADVMRVDSSGKAPVHSVGSVAMLRNLIESGVDVNQLTETRSTPLHFVGAAVIPLLINKGADVNAADIHGLTPLHKRVLDIDPEAAKLLIENGANVMAVDERDQTPLHKIASGGNFDGYSGYLEWPIASLLLDAGADVNARDKDGWTPLHHACDHHYTDSYGPELLISRGADVSIKTNDGESAANIAARQDSRESELLSNRLAWHEEKVVN